MRCDEIPCVFTVHGKRCQLKSIMCIEITKERKKEEREKMRSDTWRELERDYDVIVVAACCDCRRCRFVALNQFELIERTHSFGRIFNSASWHRWRQPQKTIPPPPLAIDDN